MVNMKAAKNKKYTHKYVAFKCRAENKQQKKKSLSKSTAAPKALVIQWLIYIFATIVHSPKSKKKSYK